MSATARIYVGNGPAVQIVDLLWSQTLVDGREVGELAEQKGRISSRTGKRNDRTVEETSRHIGANTWRSLHSAMSLGRGALIWASFRSFTLLIRLCTFCGDQERGDRGLKVVNATNFERRDREAIHGRGATAGDTDTHTQGICKRRADSCTGGRARRVRPESTHDPSRLASQLLERPT